MKMKQSYKLNMSSLAAVPYVQHGVVSGLYSYCSILQSTSRRMETFLSFFLFFLFTYQVDEAGNNETGGTMKISLLISVCFL